MADEAPKPRMTVKELDELHKLGKEAIAASHPESSYVVLPTGKPHISYSEIRCWAECSWRHKLQHVDHIDKDEPGIHLDFGTAIHSACESFLKTRVMDKKLFLKELHELWSEHAKVLPDVFTTEAFKQFAKEGLSILPDIPGWFDKQFPGWELIDAEHFLYEPLEGHPHAFKGYIDCVISAPGPRNRPLIWLLDWKTCSWGWSQWKKGDELVKAQLVLYKNFWSTKTGTDPKDVRCGFVLLKRTAKPGNHCELVTMSVGDVTTGRSLKIVNNMVFSIKQGRAVKNRESCTFCNYKGTPHCT
jgi:hypothetical protein